MITKIQVSVLAVITLILACGTDGRLAGPRDASLAAARSGRPFEVGLASPAWQAKAAQLVTEARFNPQQATRAYPLLGVAQYLAVQQAGTGGGRDRLESERGAVAGASAVVLSYVFPAATQGLEDMAAAQANASPGDVHPAFARGEAMGRAVGAEIVAYAQTDGFSRTFTGPFPQPGPTVWISNTNPPTIAGGQLPGVTPWFLTSASEFRPGAPPVPGTPAFDADLAEIRSLSDNRTATQTQIAIFWGLSVGTPTTAGFWINEATNAINARGLSEREATHLYALISASMLDAQIACWDAKQTYWFFRPWQADQLITVVPEVGKPNHPSYPSGHSCLSASAGAVLTAFFPDDQARLDAMVIEAGLSRMYAGIHYRFDIDAGRAIGRNVAALALAADAAGTSKLTPR